MIVERKYNDSIKYKYGEFSQDQMKEYKKELHSKVFWLLLYKDPKTKDEYSDVDFNKYFEFLMKEIDGLNEILFYPPQIIEIITLLEAARLESCKSEFDYKKYRKLILDAHSLIDKIKEV